MIAGVRGRLAAKTGERVLIATAGGVTYEIAVPVGVLERLPAEGTDVELRTATVVREDGWALYGFDTEHDRTVFQRLLGATGVGPKLAMAMLSALGGARTVQALKQGELGLLCTVPGIGKKTAERMVIELKDRFKDLEAPVGASAPPSSVAAEQALQALINLGYGPAEAERAVRAAVSHNGAEETVDLIRGALQRLAAR